MKKILVITLALTLVLCTFVTASATAPAPIWSVEVGFSPDGTYDGSLVAEGDLSLIDEEEPTDGPTAQPGQPTNEVTPSEPAVQVPNPTPMVPATQMQPTQEDLDQFLEYVDPVDPDDGHTHKWVSDGIINQKIYFIQQNATDHTQTKVITYQIHCSVCDITEKWDKYETYVGRHVDADGDKQCDLCAGPMGASHAHVDANHDSICDICGQVSHLDFADAPVIDVCANGNHNFVVKEQNSTVEYVPVDAAGHKVATTHTVVKKCSTCGYEISLANQTEVIKPHYFGDDSTCDVCGFVKPGATVAPTSTPATGTGSKPGTTSSPSKSNMPKTGDNTVSSAVWMMMAAACFFAFCGIRKVRTTK